jgi:hypothetical protein
MWGGMRKGHAQPCSCYSSSVDSPESLEPFQNTTSALIFSIGSQNSHSTLMPKPSLGKLFTWRSPSLSTCWHSCYSAGGKAPGNQWILSPHPISGLHKRSYDTLLNSIHSSRSDQRKAERGQPPRFPGGVQNLSMTAVIFNFTAFQFCDHPLNV